MVLGLRSESRGVVTFERGFVIRLADDIQNAPYSGLLVWKPKLQSPKSDQLLDLSQLDRVTK